MKAGRESDGQHIFARDSGSNDAGGMVAAHRTRCRGASGMGAIPHRLRFNIPEQSMRQVAAGVIKVEDTTLSVRGGTPGSMKCQGPHQKGISPASQAHLARDHRLQSVNAIRC